MNILISWKNKKPGVVAFVTMLVIANILMISTVSLVINNIDHAQATISLRNGEYLQAVSKSCLDEALLRLRNNNDFAGVVSLSLSNNIECQLTVSDGAQLGTKSVAIITTKDNYTYNINYTIDISGNRPIVTEVN